MVLGSGWGWTDKILNQGDKRWNDLAGEKTPPPGRSEGLKL
jgi:hypothetical protein